MNSPRKGPRHRSWASDTVIFAVVFLVVLIVTVSVDGLNGHDPAPTYLIGLLGASATALFAAAGSDKSKRDAELEQKLDTVAGEATIAKERADVAASRAIDINETAVRAEAKANNALTRSNASVVHVLDVQERELVANRTALQLMRDAVQVKEDSGIPVLPETRDAITQMERQIEQLVADIHKRRLEVADDQQGAVDNGGGDP